MAKVTVYVTDDQLDRLKQAKGFGKVGMSKAFQAFLESAMAGEAPAGRYDYARKLMPLSAAIDRHRRRLARKVEVGGPPADGGPVAAALTVLLYQELLKRDPELGSKLEKEFLRFGLDDLVATETEGVDLLSEPEPDEVEVEEGDAGPFGGAFDFQLGADILKETLRLAGREAMRGGPRHGGPRGHRREIRVTIDAEDDPRQVLTVTEFETFTRRHDDWSPGTPLSPSQMETVRDLLVERTKGQEEK
jgi:hypothetical protein